MISMLLEVTISGAVGKQVVSKTNAQAELRGIVLSPSGANASVKIRDQHGGVSGEIVIFTRALSAQGSQYYKVCHKFTKGMHVTVLGGSSTAYLELY